MPLNILNMKKAQMQMAESIAIMVVVLILLIFALVFYGKVKESSIIQKKSLFQELDVVKLSQIAYSLPEVQCSFASVVDYGCIDLLKFEYLSEMINNSFHNEGKVYFYYRELFGTSNISLTTYENNYGNNYYEIHNLYETNKSWSSKSVIYIPMTAFDPITNENKFSVLKVEKYD